MNKICFSVVMTKHNGFISAYFTFSERLFKNKTSLRPTRFSESLNPSFCTSRIVGTFRNYLPGFFRHEIIIAHFDGCRKDKITPPPPTMEERIKMKLTSPLYLPLDA